MIYPPDIARDLVSRWPRDEAIPEVRLRELLEIAWAATLLEEEGRRTVFTLAYATSEEAQRFGARLEVFRSAVELKRTPVDVIVGS